MSSYSMPALLGTAKSFRGKVSMVTIAVAFVLSIMVIDTRRKCDSTDQEKYKQSTMFSEVISIIVLILCCYL